MTVQYYAEATRIAAQPCAATRSRAQRYLQVEQVAQAQGLEIYGAFRPAEADRPAVGLSLGTLVLLGTGGQFWPRFTKSCEYADGQPDPIDRWSTRIVTAIARDLGATAYFPFGAPPYQPFVAWALASGRAFTSPSQMLVHDRYGMLTSYRGALHFDQSFDIPPPVLAQSPCATCTSKPCLTSCPAQALVDGGPYDLAACHHHLDSPAGTPCMTQGCLARCACPLSQRAGRCSDQTAHHMRYFNPS
ncbi:ferredoxin [Pseudophaeobacter profundi]|uniref:ferredoxin n=1 Tax=Pseudophaeobacter profundi TaxID=3034152 RepID=UPI00242F656A|nr:ferredoxin [Pseudophaeobacter profundi]